MKTGMEFWEIYLHVQIYMIVVVVAVMTLFLLFGGPQRNETLRHYQDKIVGYTSSAEKIYGMVKSYVKITLRSKVNKFFGFIEIEAKPARIRHITITLPDGDVYTIAFTKKNVNTVVSVKDLETQEDLTSSFLRFLGPGNNFFGIETKPYMLGMENITIKYNDDTEKTFGRMDIIKL